MSRRLFNCGGYKMRNKFFLFILILIICVNFSNSYNAREGLATMQNNVLMGVGANYQLATYTGSTWVPVEKPPGLAKPMLLAVTLGPDGNLYAAGNDFHLYVAQGGAWVKPQQPTSLQFLSIATENNQLVGVTTNYQLERYNISTKVVNPFAGETGPVISVLNFENTDFGVKTDHKLYKWINSKWVLYDGEGPNGKGLLNICQHNGQMYGIGTDQKMYIYQGVPGKWGAAAGNTGVKLLSIYSMTHDNYLKFGFF